MRRTAIDELAAEMRELPTASDMETTVNSAIKVKSREAVQARSAVMQENIVQSMTVEFEGRIAERTDPATNTCRWKISIYIPIIQRFAGYSASMTAPIVWVVDGLS